MKKIILITITSFNLLSYNLFSQSGGMLLPHTIDSDEEKEMKKMGLRISTKDIYSLNKPSIKDAVVRLGGCTAQIISAEGLLLTNHHCGYHSIQKHSSLENNYLKEGFWAKTRNQELPNKNLSATFVKNIYDITDSVLMGITSDIKESKRADMISQNIEKIKENTILESHENIMIKPFYNGNMYLAFITEEFKDIRLVGAPPSSIGKYGSDTDNWMWPRHTGDFTLFRIYAGKDNKPAEFSKDNIPYKPKHFFPISIDGVDEGDFTMIFGFPGKTDKYLPSVAVKQIINTNNHIKISIRNESLKVLDRHMRSSETDRIKYASKQSRIANYWKKWIGESYGLKQTNTLDKKQDFEDEFRKRVKGNREYEEILDGFEKYYKEILPYSRAKDYFTEMYYNTDILKFYSKIKSFLGDGEGTENAEKIKKDILNYVDDHFDNYTEKVDMEIFQSLIGIYMAEIGEEFIPKYLNDLSEEYQRDYEKMSKELFSKTVLTKPRALKSYIEEKSIPELMKMILEDPMCKLSKSIIEVYNQNTMVNYDRINSDIKDLQRKYIKAQMEVFPEKKYSPDANGTLRLSYGKVRGYKSEKGVEYSPFSYLEGVVKKYKPGDYEFDLPQKLIDLYQKKDYGIYGKDGKMPVCFLGSNHTTGGNSGSPAIDAHGNLIGLNFDRVWEGTMSDINYDPSICRNIMVDIRYILFVIDKFADSKHLIDEMEIVHPKEKY
nr:S46 family peptidase [Ichthyobacterium seriolicida]